MSSGGVSSGGLVAERITAGYGRRDVLSDVSLGPLSSGEVTMLVGPNAAGKSTLLRALAGLVRVSGSVRLDGQELVGLPPRRRARHVAFMPQSLPGSLDLTALEAVLSALLAVPQPPRSESGGSTDDGGSEGSAGSDRSSARREPTERALTALARLGIQSLAMEPLGRLSGGQRQLVSLAQSIVRGPRVLLLDEPTSALDLRYQVVVMRLLRAEAEAGRIVALVVHDLTLAARWADRIALLRDGRIVAAATPEEALTSDRLREVYGVRTRVERCSRGTLQVIVDGEG